MLALGWLATSCSSGKEDVGEVADAGYGVLSVNLAADAAFGVTRAVDESFYANTDNYTVRIVKDDKVLHEFKYADRAATYQLVNGNYDLVAFCGTESVASRSGFYVKGTTAFSVNGDEQTVEVTCAPTCGKVQAVFGDGMPDYFKDYSVTYTTAALQEKGETVVYKKDDTDPWYLLLNPAGEEVKATVSYTQISTNRTYQVEQSYVLKPNQSWTLRLEPSVNTGKLVLTITVDESTNDKPIDIEVPFDWI